MAADLVRLLEPEYDVVATVGDGRALVKAVNAYEPDVVVTDIGMPKLSGLEAARIILAEHPSMPVVVATIRDERVFVSSARAIGVLGFVVKADAGDELVDAVRSVLDGRPYLSSAVRSLPDDEPSATEGKT